MINRRHNLTNRHNKKPGHLLQKKKKKKNKYLNSPLWKRVTSYLSYNYNQMPAHRAVTLEQRESTLWKWSALWCAIDYPLLQTPPEIDDVHFVIFSTGADYTDTNEPQSSTKPRSNLGRKDLTVFVVLRRGSWVPVWLQ